MAVAVGNADRGSGWIEGPAGGWADILPSVAGDTDGAMALAGLVPGGSGESGGAPEIGCEGGAAGATAGEVGCAIGSPDGAYVAGAQARAAPSVSVTIRRIGLKSGQLLAAEDIIPISTHPSRQTGGRMTFSSMG